MSFLKLTEAASIFLFVLEDYYSTFLMALLSSDIISDLILADASPIRFSIYDDLAFVSSSLALS